jgi:hypothetical protein
MSIHALVKSANFADFEPLDISSLYLLAAPATPHCARDEVAERVRLGGRPTHGEVQHIVQWAKLHPVSVECQPVKLSRVSFATANLSSLTRDRAAAAVTALLDARC